MLHILPSADAGHTKLLEQRALEPLLHRATETSPGQQGPWQGALPLQALAALAAPCSNLRRHILSSMQQLVPAMLAASIGDEHNQQMLVAMLHVICHKLAPFAEKESAAAGSLGLNLLTGVVQLTKVSPYILTSIEKLTMERHSLPGLELQCCEPSRCGCAHVNNSAPVGVKHRLQKRLLQHACHKHSL